jgi:ribonuclease HI
MEEFHVEGSMFQTVYAFTDGSAKDDQAGWGVFFKDGSRFNAYGKVTGVSTNYAAELEAIEYALSVAPITTFLVIFTDSKSAVDAIKAARNLSPTQLSKQPKANTLWRICNIFNKRENKGNDITLAHVYSHQAEKIRSNPNKWAKLIETSNQRLARRYPEVNAALSNEQADRLAEKGRKEGIRPNIIPEGMDAYVVVTKGSKVPLFRSDVRRNILTTDKKDWATKANELVHKDDNKWWDDEVTHVPLSNPKVNTWVRRARYHNRTTTVLLNENLSNKNSPRFQHIKAAVALQKCPMMGCTDLDTQDHIFTCRHSARDLANISTKVRNATRDLAKEILA